jgi:hypothetical protein
MLLIRTTAFDIGRVTHAGDGSKWTIDQSDDLTHRDIRRGLGKEVAAMFTTLAVNDSGLAELEENLLQKWKRYTFAGYDFLKSQKFTPSFSGHGQSYQGPQCIFSPLRDFHTEKWE